MKIYILSAVFISSVGIAVCQDEVIEKSFHDYPPGSTDLVPEPAKSSEVKVERIKVSTEIITSERAEIERLKREVQKLKADVDALKIENEKLRRELSVRWLRKTGPGGSSGPVNTN